MRPTRRVGAFLRCWSFVLRSMRLRLAAVALSAAAGRCGSAIFADRNVRRATVGHEIDPGATNYQRFGSIRPKKPICKTLKTREKEIKFKTDQRLYHSAQSSLDGTRTRRRPKGSGPRPTTRPASPGNCGLAPRGGRLPQATKYHSHSHQASREAQRRTGGSRGKRAPSNTNLTAPKAPKP